MDTLEDEEVVIIRKTTNCFTVVLVLDAHIGGIACVKLFKMQRLNESLEELLLYGVVIDGQVLPQP